MINFEQYLIERKGSSAGQQTKRKVTKEQLKQMITNKDSNIADVDVSEITDMSELFKGSDFGGSWTADISEWDTSKVEDMGKMFWGCKELTKVELPNTEKVEDMRYVFNGCENLQQDFSSWDITNVRYKDDMFRGCTKMQTAKMNGNDLYPKGYK